METTARPYEWRRRPRSYFWPCRFLWSAEHGWRGRSIGWLPDCDPRDQMEIHASLALSLMFTAGNSERVRDAFNTALTFAERHEDTYLQLRLLSGLSMYLHRTIDAAGSLEVALRAGPSRRKTGSPDDAALADSMLGAAYYMLADHVRAPKHLNGPCTGRRLPDGSTQPVPVRSPHALRLFDLTRSHWFAGNLDRAADYAERTIEEAEDQSIRSPCVEPSF